MITAKQQEWLVVELNRIKKDGYEVRKDLARLIDDISWILNAVVDPDEEIGSD